MSRNSSRITIDLAALGANYDLIKSKVAPTCMVSAVVKANAYGTGIEQAAKVLESKACPYYFVATLDEALTLRKYTQKPIAVLGGLYPGAENEYGVNGVVPVMNSVEEIRRDTYNRPAIWHVDTGINRLGLDVPDVISLLESNFRLPSMVMSHFACSDESRNPMNQTQAQRFTQVANYLPLAKKSLANSSGIFRDPAWHHDMVRPGMALYGLNPTPEKPNPMQPVVGLETRLLQVKPARARDTVGYGATYTIPQNTTIGIVGLGYADGFLRSGSNSAKLYWQGQPCPVLGRVSMDLIAVDLGSLPQDQPQPHDTDWLEVLGPHQSADQLATSCGTIGYEILTSLSRRSERVYKGL